MTQEKEQKKGKEEDIKLKKAEIVQEKKESKSGKLMTLTKW